MPAYVHCWGHASSVNHSLLAIQHAAYIGKSVSGPLDLPTQVTINACIMCRSVGATVVEMLTGKRPFYEYKEKMAVIFALGSMTLSLDELICGPDFSDEVQEFLRLCINW